MLVRDHTAVRQQGRDLAKWLGVTPTPPKHTPPEPGHLKAMAALKAKSGAEFDTSVVSDFDLLQRLFRVSTRLLHLLGHRQ